MFSPMSTLDEFLQEIGYSFKNSLLLEEALTHPSTRQSRNSKPFNYQRLEFLGDAILGMVISEMLFKAYDKQNEGFLSKQKAVLTSREYCYHVGKKINIADMLKLSSGEEKNGGRTLQTNIANAVESLIAAIYLDSKSIQKSRQFIKKYWDIAPDKTVSCDAKTMLQEWSQERFGTLPSYELITTQGPDHAPSFVAEVAIGDLKTKGVGKTKKTAEKMAAEKMLEKIKPAKQR